jgi:hypothetical protein
MQKIAASWLAGLLRTAEKRRIPLLIRVGQ